MAADLTGKFPLFTWFCACAHYREQWILPGKSAATKRPESLLLNYFNKAATVENSAIVLSVFTIY